MEAELRELREAGYDRLCLGIDGGRIGVLLYQEKGGELPWERRGCESPGRDAGMRYSVYIMLGLGGRALSEEHIAETASFSERGASF